MRFHRMSCAMAATISALLAACGGPSPSAFAEGSSATPEAASALLPEGTYACSLYSGGMLMGFGDIEVDGARYRGPGYDGDFPDGWNNYNMSAEGAVVWGGKLGGLDSDGNKVVSSVLTTGDNGEIFIRNIVMTGGGGNQTVDCRLGG